MLYENFVWTKELTQEFNKVILDNYHCIDDIDIATFEFVKSKINKNHGKRTTTGSFIREIRDTERGTIGNYSSNTKH